MEGVCALCPPQAGNRPSGSPAVPRVKCKQPVFPSLDAEGRKENRFHPRCFLPRRLAGRIPGCENKSGTNNEKLKQ